MHKIVFPHKPGSGGPGSFQIRFEKALKELGYQISYKNDRDKPDLIFIVGGTSKIFWLLKMKFKGVPIVYRLDGLNWLHKKKRKELKKYLLGEYRNWNNKLIHAFFADFVIYQSSFVENWWIKKGWKKHKNTTIIYNGVQISKRINKDSKKYNENKRVVILEGTIDYSPYAVQLMNDLCKYLPNDFKIELYGNFEDKREQIKLHSDINYKGFLERSGVNQVLSNSIYISLDINPACPNTVIEALSAGSPVVAFDTGAIPELIDDTCGAVVKYGSNPWELAYPDVKSMAEAIVNVEKNYGSLSGHAFDKATQSYDIGQVVEQYIDIITKNIK